MVGGQAFRDVFLSSTNEVSTENTCQKVGLFGWLAVCVHMFSDCLSKVSSWSKYSLLAVDLVSALFRTMSPVIQELG